MGPLTHQIRAWDGLPLCVREWPGDPAAPPILALPGLVRTCGDFDGVAPAVAGGRRVISLDYMGRGASGRSPVLQRYGPEACVRDILDVCTAFHVHRAVVLGTSFGGLLAMGLAAARPSLIRAVVLNDIGPDIGSEGSAFVRDFVGLDPALPDLDACVAFLRSRLPPLSIETEPEWRRMAELTYQPSSDGRWRPVWDIRIAQLLNGPAPDLWTLWGALAHVPVILVRGGLSNILLAGTVARMRSERPDMPVIEIPNVGHAPILTESAARIGIQTFLARHA